ncbi:MAG: DNA (cytosine-5-)-methyltransferase [Muribaculaceae bacterium]|nr:DNA (cytosine-5-)-methyltransferase [Muribaculaceae bacterium]
MFISESNLAAITGTSTATTHGWAEKGIYPSKRNNDGIKGFDMEDLMDIPEIAAMVNNNWIDEMDVTPIRDFTSVELFAGGGGLALGLEKAGLKHVLLNEFDTYACNTLRTNRPNWNIIEGDIRHIDFTPLRDKIDFISGGFPCQAFSFAGKQGGFNDIRGTLFFELARAVKEIRPRVFLGENVKGLVSHDKGKTFRTICNIISELGYTLVTPRVLNGIMYQVPQKRERIILIAIRNDIAGQVTFNWPSPYERVMTLRDALYKSDIYDSDVPVSEGAKYPEKKRKILDLIPQGGDWRDLPEDIAKEYMGGSWYLGGGKTGMARRLALDEPSLTLTCSPAQKQTERCHPTLTRPLSIREYARIQTFPDNWIFQGTMNAQYKQIGNAVPVNLAWAIGRAIIRLLNDIETVHPLRVIDLDNAIKKILVSQKSIVAKKNNKTQTASVIKGHRQLNLFDVFNDSLNGIVCENLISEDKPEYYIPRTSAHVLIALIKKEGEKPFVTQSAYNYFTGSRFPATIDLKNLTYFIPYIKGKGIKDLYIIKKTHIKEYHKPGNDKTEYRLCFDIQFSKQLFDEYKMCKLDIWRTFTDTTINIIMNNQL